MITDFNIFKPKPKKNLPKIGDFVIINYAELYGIIIDSGKWQHKKRIDFYLIEILTPVSNDRSENMKNNFKNCYYIIRTLNTKLKNENMNGAWIGNYPNYIWYSPHNFTFYDSSQKEKYDEVVEEIEMKKSANKYNL